MTESPVRRLQPYRRIYVHPEIAMMGEPKDGRVHAVVSTETRDRQGDIIRLEGWDLTRFKTHPVLVANHNYRSVLAQIGEWLTLGINKESKALEGEVKYYIGEGNPEADWAFKLATKGRAAFSVGFKPDMEKATVLDGGNDYSGPFEFNGQELLEVSQVVIPANPEALQTAKTLFLPGAVQALLEEILLERIRALDSGARHNALQEAISKW